MSYTITVTGHKDGLDADQAREFEEGIAARAREFVRELEGANSASMAGAIVGRVDLLEQP